MKSVGLTGGIASGKSTVAAILKRWGYQVLSADALAHQAIEKGTPGYESVIKRFGKDVLSANGEINRQALGELIFTNRSSREWLEQLIHPIVIAAIRAEIALGAQQGLKFLIVEVPLLFEAGLCDLFDLIWVVSIDPEEQVRRVCQRDRLTEDQAKLRLASQMRAQERESRADTIIYNNLGQKELEAQVRDLLKTLE